MDTEITIQLEWPEELKKEFYRKVFGEFGRSDYANLVAIMSLDKHGRVTNTITGVHTTEATETDRAIIAAHRALAVI